MIKPRLAVQPLAVVGNVEGLKEVLASDGYVIVEGVEPSEERLVEIASMLGNVDLDADPVLVGPRVMDVRHDGLRSQTTRQPTYFTNNIFPLHTDLSYIPRPPKYLLMHCVQSSSNGGITCIANCIDAFHGLPAAHQRILSREIFRFRYPPGCPESHSRPMPVFIEMSGRSVFRLKASAMDFPDYAKRSLDLFGKALQRRMEQHFLESGELIIVDNHLYAHGRTEFQDDESRPRHLRRVYVE